MEKKEPEGLLWNIKEYFWKKGGHIHLPIDGASRAWVVGRNTPPLLVVLPDQRQAEDFISDYENLWQGESAELLYELPLTVEGIRNKPLYLQRGEVLSSWEKKGGILATTPGGLLSPFLIGDGLFHLKRNSNYIRSRLLSWLENAGYERVDLVWSPGQYVVRGFIVDIYDPAYALPIRVEFFDEEIESIRSFHPQSQTSVSELEEIEIHSIKTARKKVLEDILPSSCKVILFEPSLIENKAESYRWLWEDLRHEGDIPSLPSWPDFVISTLSAKSKVRISTTIARSEESFDIQECPHFRGDIEKFKWTCTYWRKELYSIHIVSSGTSLQNDKEIQSHVIFHKGALSKGFIDVSRKEVWISDYEIAGVTVSRSAKPWRALPLDWKERLIENQLVIHEDYGVAVYRGVEEIISGEEKLDSLVLEFANKQRLLVPFVQVHKISPLHEEATADAVLDSLRGTRWKKSLERTKERIQEEVKTLIRLYARRELLKGYAFPPNTEMYRHFVEAFTYVETSDQLQAEKDICEDMESPYPMDRLLVGDVGFGKTEVAMRAAFKAAEAGKQVVVLVPTTILAQQHYHTFRSRMAGFPLRIEVLSRFISSSKQKKILEDTKNGRVDILIGTQRLLQKDIEFADLGLLIVDEEHRFGVMHKEKLKETREGIDVLTLSATPIPRTLSLSLRGLRSFSVISTPPYNRLPVLTMVGPRRKDVMERAVLRELNRGGQVFFVSNRINRLKNIFVELKHMFPDAKIGIAHGQLAERDLEITMLDFYNGNLDILVCTTIVESGLDIPRANTLIVDNAQELGLAQMYQLRGRVGRREEGAYAFFLYPENVPLQKETAERFEAISAFSDIGSGYNLALQDLKIRGSGDLVGVTQHGQGEHMGYHLYYKMLEEEIARVRGELFLETPVDSELTGAIPSSYIPQENIRITLYRRLLKNSTWQELEELRKEIRDRFGPLPDALAYLINTAIVRNCGSFVGITSIVSGLDQTVIMFKKEDLYSKLKNIKGWIKTIDRIVGPGGYKGMSNAANAIQSLLSTKLDMEGKK